MRAGYALEAESEHHPRYLSRVAAAVLVCLILAGSPVLAAESGSPEDPAWQGAMERVVEQYIRAHPEVVEQALQSLEAKRVAEEQARVKSVIAARQAELLAGPASRASQNGEVTIVEFFDYRCAFCRRVAGVVAQLQQDDPRVRVVYKDFPILGEASEVAARAALASEAQGRHQAFHDALLAAQEELTREEVLRIAAEVGLDAKRLGADMNKAEWSAVLARNRALAAELGISGTPAFVVGQEIQMGAAELATLRDLVARARQTAAK